MRYNRKSKLAVLLAVFSLIAAACSGSEQGMSLDDLQDQGPDQTAQPVDTAVPVETTTTTSTTTTTTLPETNTLEDLVANDFVFEPEVTPENPVLFVWPGPYTAREWSEEFLAATWADMHEHWNTYLVANNIAPMEVPEYVFIHDDAPAYESECVGLGGGNKFNAETEYAFYCVYDDVSVFPHHSVWRSLNESGGTIAPITNDDSPSSSGGVFVAGMVIGHQYAYPLIYHIRQQLDLNVPSDYDQIMLADCLAATWVHTIVEKSHLHKAAMAHVGARLNWLARPEFKPLEPSKFAREDAILRGFWSEETAGDPGACIQNHWINPVEPEFGS